MTVTTEDTMTDMERTPELAPWAKKLFDEFWALEERRIEARARTANLLLEPRGTDIQEALANTIRGSLPLEKRQDEIRRLLNGDAGRSEVRDAIDVAQAEASKAELESLRTELKLYKKRDEQFEEIMEHARQLLAKEGYEWDADQGVFVRVERD